MLIIEFIGYKMVIVLLGTDCLLCWFCFSSVNQICTGSLNSTIILILSVEGQFGIGVKSHRLETGTQLSNFA